MKKLRNKFLILLSAFSLLSCVNTNKVKYQLNKVDDGQLIQINGEQLYNLSIEQKENVVCLFKIDNCASCSYAFTQTNEFCKLNQCIMYYIDIGTTDEENYNKIVSATTYVDDYYAFKEYGSPLELPIVYFFLDQAVVFTVSDNFIDFYIDNIEII